MLNIFDRKIKTYGNFVSYCGQQSVDNSDTRDTAHRTPDTAILSVANGENKTNTNTQQIKLMDNKTTNQILWKINLLSNRSLLVDFILHSCIALHCIASWFKRFHYFFLYSPVVRSNKFNCVLANSEFLNRNVIPFRTKGMLAAHFSPFEQHKLSEFLVQLNPLVLRFVNESIEELVEYLIGI